MTVREIEEGQTALALAALQELRPHVAGVDEVDALRPGGYRLAGSFEDDGDDAVCVAGFRVTDNLVSGRHLYVDDLVTRENVRSGGHGAAVLEWLAGEARKAGCTSLQLDSNVKRSAAHRFYFRHGLVVEAFHFAKTL